MKGSMRAFHSAALGAKRARSTNRQTATEAGHAYSRMRRSPRATAVTRPTAVRIRYGRISVGNSTPSDDSWVHLKWAVYWMRRMNGNAQNAVRQNATANTRASRSEEH